MKISIVKIIVILFIVAAKTNCFAQSNDYFTENVKRIEAYINGYAKANICEGTITYPSKYKTSKVKSDVFIISFLNKVIGSKVEEQDVDVSIEKIGKKKVSVKESLHGLIKAKDILVKGKYLRARVRIEFIDNTVVRAKAVLTTTSHATCGVYENRMMDFKLVKDYFIKDARLLFSVGYDEMGSDTVYSNNLTLLTEKRKDYRFNIPGTDSENWVNDIFIKQYQTDSSGSYNYTKAPKDFVRLIKENKIPAIQDLLFSPNYFVAVNAMEALIYLASVGKVQLTGELNEKIVQVKSGTFKFLSQGAPDVFYPREGYKDLRMTDERVVSKYSSSM